MKPEFLFDQYLQQQLTAAEAEELKGLLREPAGAQAFVEYVGETALLVRIANRMTASQALTSAIPVSAAAAAQLRRPARHLAGRWLAAAAGLALTVAGGLWFMLRPAAPGLRLAESQGVVAVTRAGNAVPAVSGMLLQPGDRVAVPAGGKAALKYEAEETTIALHSATATFRSEKGAKRIKLDAGFLVCTAAPQQQPFRLETPHAVAEVIGTRFWLEASPTETALAVQAGKVALCQEARLLEVQAGETAVADATGLRKLSPADAWIRELLARVETGSWDAVDFGKGVFAQDVWRLDARGAGAARLLWNVSTDPDPSVAHSLVFDQARWKRGVVSARVMLLTSGQRQPELPVSNAVVNPQWQVQRASIQSIPEEGKSGLLQGILYRGRPEAAEGTDVPCLSIARNQRGVWHRWVTYFDTDAEGGPLVMMACWPEADSRPPVAGKWQRGQGKVLGRVMAEGDRVGLGFLAYASRVQASALKLVPLGPDLPPPPATSANGSADHGRRE